MNKREIDIQRIINSVKKAYYKDMPEFYNDRKLITHNGDPGIRWDFINTNINNIFTEDDYKILIVKRGFWNQIVIYNTYDKRLYFIMRENRYKDIKRDKNRKNLHLIQILGAVNENEETEASEVIKQKLPEYISKAKEYILITYEYNENQSKFDFIGRKITSKFRCSYKEEFDNKLNLEEAN
ncbi:DUF5986 family protein [Romboutsia sp. 1001216sp1]|uniref:DUF5986 family protein n=1 Tax=unclassified Romboutsia TaxID=2626894 RepID=UPI00189F44ED|nr:MULTISPECIES: DUF5986 family protein [unclassified Romboutsia]MDB8801227.1 DUF5986 family protein [Romboutsia sp. 1001216sp1]MDB8812626.1 DUF5986 family protein [Romboutsia sp. 1001216sp1]